MLLKWLGLAALLYVLIPVRLSAQNVSAYGPSPYSPSETVRNFIAWYGRNMQVLSDGALIDMRPGNGENEEVSYYRINQKEAESYFWVLTQCGFFSKKYIIAQRIRIQKADEYFKQHPQNEGPPEGFQWDPFLLTQDDCASDLAKSTQLKIITRGKRKTTAKVYAYFPVCRISYWYTLSWESGRWRIDRIERPD